MTIWFGRPGALTALPDPAPGVSAPLVRVAAEHVTLGGGRSIDFTGPGRRTHVLRWERLTDAEYAVLEAYHSGAHGPGPWLYLPSGAAWNYLSPNQASGTDATGDTTGFTTVGAGTEIVSRRSDAVTGTRLLGWSLPNPLPADARLVLAGQHGWPGVPVPPGTPVTFSAHVRAATALDLSVVLRWLDRDGDRISDSSGPPADPTDNWTRHTVTATPPADAVYAVPTITARATAPVVAAPGDTVQLDAMRLDHTAGPWRPGRGVPLVSLVELTDDYPWADLHDCSATLVEVG